MSKKETKDIKNKKQNLSFMLLVILLISVILCISSFGIVTWARYRSATGGNVEAQIAKWSFKVNGEEEQFADINLADTIDFTHVITDKIAPGTYGSFDLDIDGRGSEVSLDYYINITAIGKPLNLKFYSDSQYSNLISVTSDNKLLLDGDLLLSEVMQETRTIYWKWDYRTQNLPSEDVLQGYYSSIDGLELLVNEYNAGTEEQKQEIVMKINDKIDTYQQGGDIVLEVQVKGIQINPEFSLKRVQIISQTNEKYDDGETVDFALEFTENVYADNNQTVIDSTNAPEVTVGFGTVANNPIVKVASLVNTNIQLSVGGKLATFVSVNGNKLNYSYTIKSGDNGNLEISNIIGTVYNKDGKILNLGTIDVPKITEGNILAESLQIGDYVNINTNLLGNLNNITLADQSHPQADWRVFYIEDDKICLILADIIPVSKIPSGTGLSVKNKYSVYGSTRAKLLSGLTSAQWNKLVLGTDVELIENVQVKGGVDVIGWCKSWNDNVNNYIHLYTNGSKVGTTSSISGIQVELRNSPGYNDTLYFPHKSIWNGCSQYWLANVNPTNSEAFYDIAWAEQDVNGLIGLDWERYYRTFEGIRPVIYLPLNDIKFVRTENIWKIQEVDN